MSNRALRHTAALAAIGVTGAVAVPAFAHAPVLGTSPRNGATVKNVRTVSVRFGESVVTGLINVRRTDGGSMSAPTASGLQPSNHARLRAVFARRLPAGKYSVSWRARADDGHRERGSFRFTVRR
jgi:methionine-rich copper-binding protein CopC